MGKATPGWSSPVSLRGTGVAVGSTETTERTGKTRSTASGLRAEPLKPEGEDVSVSVAAEKMLIGLVVGIEPSVFGLAALTPFDGGPPDPEGCPPADEVLEEVGGAEVVVGEEGRGCPSDDIGIRPSEAF